MNSPRFSFGRSFRIGALVVAAGLMIAPAIAAQDDAKEAHPAHIHSGTCDQLGDVVVPLADVAEPTGEQMGPQGGYAVKISEGNRVDMPLQDIIEGGHAINVHLSADEIGTYIACGDIGGIVHDMEGGGGGKEIVIALHELNDSGHVGTAWLGEVDGATMVTVSLIEPEEMSGGTAAAPEEAGTPAADAAAASAVQIKDFAYNPPSITVPVGGSVTWTNDDGVPHTATGLDREILQSGAIASGASYTQTFDTAGSYDYFCEFHPNMKGTVVVE